MVRAIMGWFCWRVGSCQKVNKTWPTSIDVTARLQVIASFSPLLGASDSRADFAKKTLK